MLKLAYQIEKRICPRFYENYFSLECFNQRSTRNATYNYLQTNKATNKSVKCEAARLWLDLPTNIKEIPLYSTFKKQLRNYLLEMQLNEYVNHVNFDPNDSLIFNILEDIA